MKDVVRVAFVLMMAAGAANGYVCTFEVWTTNGNDPAGGEFQIYGRLTDLPPNGRVRGLTTLVVPLIEGTYDVGSLVNELPAAWYIDIRGNRNKSGGMVMSRSGEDTVPENPITGAQDVLGTVSAMLLNGIGIENIDIETQIGAPDDVYVPSQHVPGQARKRATFPVLIGYGTYSAGTVPELSSDGAANVLYNGPPDSEDIYYSVIPEPTTIALFGVLAIGLFRRRA